MLIPGVESRASYIYNEYRNRPWIGLSLFGGIDEEEGGWIAEGGNASQFLSLL